jgi:Ras-related protein Rab-1A/Rab family protein
MQVGCEDYRVVMIGETSVGKTSIISQLIERTFNPNISSTVGANFQQYCKTIGDRTITLQLWDTAGQERFRALSPIYYRGAHAAIAVFSFDNHDSLESLPEQISLFLEVAKDAQIFVVGNKVDIDMPAFSESEAEAFATEKKWKMFLTSAKTGEGIENFFDVVCQEMAKVKIEKKPQFIPGKQENQCC